MNRAQIFGGIVRSWIVLPLITCFIDRLQGDRIRAVTGRFALSNPAKHAEWRYGYLQFGARNKTTCMLSFELNKERHMLHDEASPTAGPNHGGFSRISAIDEDLQQHWIGRADRAALGQYIPAGGSILKGNAPDHVNLRRPCLMITEFWQFCQRVRQLLDPASATISLSISHALDANSVRVTDHTAEIKNP